MDGEMQFSNAGRFAALKDLVDTDLKDRAQWYDRAVKNRTERLKRTNTVKPMYEDEPTLVDPIIDDLIRELKQSIVTTLWQAPHLAQFIGLDDTGVAQAEPAEAAFDFHLRKTCRTRSRISQCVDDELTFGYGLSKLVEVAGHGGLVVTAEGTYRDKRVALKKSGGRHGGRPSSVDRHVSPQYWRAGLCPGRIGRDFFSATDKRTK